MRTVLCRVKTEWDRELSPEVCHEGEKNGILHSGSRSLQELILSKYNNFYCIFCITDPFATKLGLIVHYYKLECFMEKLNCCGQGHSIILKCQWMFVQMIFSKSLNLLLPNLVWWCIIMNQIVFQKHSFAVFKVKVTVKNNVIKIWLFNILSELWSFCK